MAYWSGNMLKVGQKLVYKAFGLTLSSEIYFPELEIIRDKEELVDIEIRMNDLSKLYYDLSNEPNSFVVKKNLVMFQISDIATFSIQDGKIITVSPIKEAVEDQIRLLILGTCMGAILLQRKIFPLHGSAVAIDGKAYAFIGDSGAGKSTLASAFLKRGYQLVTDDVVAVSFSKDNLPMVTPSYPQQKLWQESLWEFGMDTSPYRPIFQRETKFSVPVSSLFSTEPLPLAGIFEVTKTESGSIEIEKIENLSRFATLFTHTYRNFLIPNLGLLDWHFNASTKILNHVGMFQLRRPASSFTAHQLVSLILTDINQGES
jgi:hypothetical protein